MELLAVGLAMDLLAVVLAMELLAVVLRRLVFVRSLREGQANFFVELLAVALRRMELRHGTACRGAPPPGLRASAVGRALHTHTHVTCAKTKK